MRMVFWQNCLSPHQLPYIVHLLDDERVDEVVVVAGETISGARKNMGWSVADYEGLDKCKVYVQPHDKIIESLFVNRQEDTQHLFSGIRADMFVFKCLKMSLAYQLKRGIITERPNTYDFKHNIPNAKPYWLHRIRFWLQDRKYAKHISNVFAMGLKAVDYYNSLSHKWKVIPFAYCTQSHSYNDYISLSGDAKYVYVGSLSPRKNPVIICKGALISKSNSEFRFIGDGSDKTKIENEVKKNKTSKILLEGIKKNSEIHNELLKSDILVLPSIYDGWGAVVNEALQAGCYVICSDAAGASDLILNDKRLGSVFHRGNVKQLAEAMSWCNEHILEIRSNRDFRMQWAEDHISGKAVAKYMIDCLEKTKN